MSADPQRTRARILKAANDAYERWTQDQDDHRLTEEVEQVAAAREALQMVKEDIEVCHKASVALDNKNRHAYFGPTQAYQDCLTIINKRLADLASDEAKPEFLKAAEAVAAEQGTDAQTVLREDVERLRASDEAGKDKA